MQSIKVGARDSVLSKKQVEEVERIFGPDIIFKPIYIKTKGDYDQETSLRTLDKTDFFTREIDQLVLEGKCRIAIHSAKDLPEPLTKGLELFALTKGVDPSDSLVLRDNHQLKKNDVIATSSFRREESVKKLLKEAIFVDIRGSIEKRLKKLETGEVDGVVVAEAALIRLGLTHLNRITLPGEVAPLQGRLAIVGRAGDTEMRALFSL